LQERLHAPDAFSDPKVLLEHAEARLATFEAIEFEEDFTNSLLQIARSRNCAVPQTFEPQNVNPERLSATSVDGPSLHLVGELTEVDREIYRSAFSKYRNSDGNFARAER
jgi:hypothetical protein